MDSEASALIGELSYRISKLEKKIDFLFKHLKIDYIEPVEGYLEEAKKFILQNKDFEAVKLVRRAKACGLHEAQKIIDDLKKSL
ncbi:MAG TPA: hypothetical protein VGK25_06820 [Ignavibacteria bacterium]|jgi:ribosomal protein L7/L12